MEKIRKFFNFAPLYGTLGFKVDLAYTQNQAIGQNMDFLSKKSKIGGGSVGNGPKCCKNKFYNILDRLEPIPTHPPHFFDFFS